MEILESNGIIACQFHFCAVISRIYFNQSITVLVITVLVILLPSLAIKYFLFDCSFSGFNTALLHQLHVNVIGVQPQCPYLFENNLEFCKLCGVILIIKSHNYARGDFPVSKLPLALMDLHTKFSGACPLWDPILSFSQTFSLKVPASEVHTPQNGSMSPLQEILDLPLIGDKMYEQFKSFKHVVEFAFKCQYEKCTNAVKCRSILN